MYCALVWNHAATVAQKDLGQQVEPGIHNP